MKGNPRDNKAPSERKPGDGYTLRLRWRREASADWNELWFREEVDRQCFSDLYRVAGFVIDGGDLWIIEARVDGELDFSDPQPASVFGIGAIRGLTEDEIAKAVYRFCDREGRKDVVLDGRNIPHWPALVDGRFWARRKTWS